ncbi:MAG: STAS-like domain-containing protein [Patescibacteria group bacterium]
MPTTILIANKAGNFAENKDVARELRLKFITPTLKDSDDEIILDFSGVTGATQSFVHAMISQLIRDYGDELFNRLLFKDCNPAVKQIVNIVADYMAES